VRGNRTGKGWFVKGRSANPGGRPKNPAIPLGYAPDLTGADRRPEQRTIAAASIVLEATAEVSDDAGEPSRIPRRMPLPDSALTQNSSAASCGTGQAPIFDAPRTFPEVKRGPCDNLVNQRHTSLNRVGLNSV
jgi:hypothetical protein